MHRGTRVNGHIKGSMSLANGCNTNSYCMVVIGTHVMSWLN